jgi:hypothetical protein
MVAITYGTARAAAGSFKKTSSGKGAFARFMSALIESRMKHAEREIALHRHLIARPLSKDELPFGGW